MQGTQLNHPRKTSSDYVGKEQVWIDAVTGKSVFGVCLYCRIGTQYAYCTVTSYGQCSVIRVSLF